MILLTFKNTKKNKKNHNSQKKKEQKEKRKEKLRDQFVNLAKLLLSILSYSKIYRGGQKNCGKKRKP